MDVSGENVKYRDMEARRKIMQAEKLVRLAEQAGFEPDRDREPPGDGGVSIREFAGRIAALFTPDEIDADTATLEEVGEAER